MLTPPTIETGNWPQTAAEFEKLITDTQDELVQFAFYRLGNRHDAEDVVQDVYIESFRDREKRRHVTEVRAYLFRMVLNRCTDILRKRPRLVYGHSDEAASAEDGFSLAAAREEARRIGDLLDRIPAPEAEVIRLRAGPDLTFAEIAAATGVSVPTVKSRFRYGLEKLRRLLNTKGESTNGTR